MKAGNEEFGRIYFYEFRECTIFCMILTNTPCILMGTFKQIRKNRSFIFGGADLCESAAQRHSVIYLILSMETVGELGGLGEFLTVSVPLTTPGPAGNPLV